MTSHPSRKVRARPSGAFLWALVVTAGLAASPSSAPQPNGIALVRAYVGEYQRASVSLLADEATTQTVERDGRVVHTRRTTGELFSTFVGSAGVWMSVHDVATVDGAPVPQRRDLPRALRVDPTHAAARDIARANAQYNIGPVARNFNEPMLALQLLAPSRARDVVIDRERFVPGPTPAGEFAFRVRLRDTATFVASTNGRHVRVEGSIVAQAETGAVVRTMLTLDDGQVSSALHTEYVRDERLELWVPATFVELYRADGAPDVTTVRSAYSNYRRFEAAGRVIN